MMFWKLPEWKMLGFFVIKIFIFEILSPQIQNELQRCSFNLPEQIIQKIKNAMQNPFKMLQMRVIH